MTNATRDYEPGSYGEGRFRDMIGRKLSTVTLNDDGAAVLFTFDEGPTARFDVEGDCCSTSWVEHLELPGNIKGATVLSVDDSVPITQDHSEHDEDNGGDSIQVYNTVFRTDRGDIVLEYRNSSNGYYGGSLVRL